MENLTTIFTTFYQSYQQARNPSLNTAKQIKGIIPAFLSYCMTEKNREFVEEIQKEDVICYLNSLIDLRTSSRLTHLRWITVFLNWLYEPLHIIIQKPETVFYKGPPDIPRAVQKDLDTKEVQKILNALPTLPDKDQAIGYLLLYRLLRIGELVNLRVENVDLKRQLVTILKSKNRTSRQILYDRLWKGRHRIPHCSTSETTPYYFTSIKFWKSRECREWVDPVTPSDIQALPIF